MKIENISFIEAMQILAKRARIELPEENISDELRAKNHLKEQIINANTEAARFFYQNLFSSSGDMAVKYLKKRGLDLRTIKKFGLGYSLNESYSLNNYLLKKGFSQEIIFKAGLVKHIDNSRYVDAFRNRVMFPIFDISSKVIGFGGRALIDIHPKYLNTSDTLVFNKSNNLFALNIAKNSKCKKIIIVEGYMDVIALHQYGIDYAVASLGTALTENQSKLLKKYSEEVIVAYDADNAGQSATTRGIEILNKFGCNIKILSIPDGKDPDEFIRKHGVDKFTGLISNAKTYMLFKIDNLKAMYPIDTIDGKIKFLNKMSSILASTENNIERDIYIRSISKDTGISSESITAQVNKILFKDERPKKFINKENKINVVTSPVDKKLDDAEKLLIYLICQNDAYEKFENKISLDLFSYSVNKKVAQEIIERLNNKKNIEPGELMIGMEEEEASSVSKIFSINSEFEDINKGIQECLNYINEIQRKQRLTELLHIIAN
jgi:DNA primase